MPYEEKIDPVAQARYESHIDSMILDSDGLSDGELLHNVQRVSEMKKVGDGTKLTDDKADAIAATLRSRGFKGQGDEGYQVPESIDGKNMIEIEMAAAQGEVSAEDIRKVYFGSIISFCDPSGEGRTYGRSLGHGNINDCLNRAHKAATADKQQDLLGLKPDDGRDR